MNKISEQKAAVWMFMAFRDMLNSLAGEDAYAFAMQEFLFKLPRNEKFDKLRQTTAFKCLYARMQTEQESDQGEAKEE